MVTLPQKTALPLIAQLSDEAQVEGAWVSLQAMIARGEAALVANVVLNGVAGKRLVSESIEEVRYPTQFDPPQVPHEVPKENAAEVLKNWPIVGITPTGFETRNTGASLEVEVTVSDNGEWISAGVVPQHVRLLRFVEYDAGLMPSGERLSVKQPLFSALKNTLSMHLRAGQPVLIGVHKVPGDEKAMELFILRISVHRTGAAQ
ncbi:MAG: ral secretion pathway protein [Chthoniobacter sp.]|nr:ral secretion pathway protein [Chthoniobacter sp.]